MKFSYEIKHDKASGVLEVEMITRPYCGNVWQAQRSSSPQWERRMLVRTVKGSPVHVGRMEVGALYSFEVGIDKTTHQVRWDGSHLLNTKTGKDAPTGVRLLFKEIALAIPGKFHGLWERVDAEGFMRAAEAKHNEALSLRAQADRLLTEAAELVSAAGNLSTQRVTLVPATH